MENPEEILHSLEEFSKMKPKDIPRELEEYLCFVAKTGDPIYQWSTIKSLFREKMIAVITEFYESCPSVEIPPCPNVDLFNYDLMKNFILEKLDTFASAPFTVQRICELLTTPRKEYNRIDKYMRALEKNVLVVSTTEPARRGANVENGESIMNGIENPSDINVEEMDETPLWPRITYHVAEPQNGIEKDENTPSSSVIVPYVSIEAVDITHQSEIANQDTESATITAVPAGVQQRRSSVEDVKAETNESNSEDAAVAETISEDKQEENPEPEAAATTPPPAPEPEPVEVAAEEVAEAKLVEAEPSEKCSGIENISPETSSSSPESDEISLPEDVKVAVEEAKEDEITSTVQDEEKVEDVEKCDENNKEESVLKEETTTEITEITEISQTAEVPAESTSTEEVVTSMEVDKEVEKQD